LLALGGDPAYSEFDEFHFADFFWAYEMKASLFCTARYTGAAPHDIWPLPGEYYSCDAAVRSMQTTFDQFRCADESALTG